MGDKSAGGSTSLAYLFLSLALLSLVFYGCSAVTVPNPEEVLSTPLGTESVKIGMSKNQVESLWGKPDSTRIVEDPKRWQSPREVWTYNSRMSGMSINAGYLTNTRALYFDGDNLTSIEND